MNAAAAVAVAVTFAWVGMVTAISFVEAPLKFRAPNVTLQIGLGIGRLVFRALNTIEMVFAIILVVVIALSRPSVPVIVAFAVVIMALIVQVAVIRPRLNKRSDRVLAGYQGPRSRVHHVYVGFEVAKLIALLMAGILLLSG